MADIPLGLLTSSGSAGVRLSGAQSGNCGFTANSATYGQAASASGVNASAALTTVISLSVPAGKKMIVLAAALSGLTSTSQTTTITVEIDGVDVLTFTGASAVDNPRVVGYDSSSSLSNLQAAIKDLLVTSNIKLKLQKSAATSAGASISYILVA